MNDRTSNAPPVDFIGPDDVAAYERQFYLNNAPPRPISSGGQSIKKAPNRFFAPLWDGVREKLHLTRSKSATSIASTKSERPVSRQEQQQAKPAVASNPLAYPTREEVMESYKSLMDSGFFTNHAIQGTRHPIRTAGGQHAPTAPAPAPPSQTFSQHLAQHQHQRPPPTQHQPRSVLAFSAIPYSATRAPSSGDPPLAPYPRPTAATRMASSHGRHNNNGAPLADSPQRGTKRAMADIAGGVPDREWPETGARKLAKKLRKSASRISADMSLAAAAAAGHKSAVMTSSRPSTAVPGPASWPSVGKEAPRHSVSTMRSFSSSWKPGAAGGGGGGCGEKKSGGGNPNRLTKAKKVLGGGRRRRRSTSRSPGPVARPQLSQPSHPPIPLRPAPSLPAMPAEPMAIDSPTRPSFDGIVNGLSVPSFHYPQRMRLRSNSEGNGGAPGPLSVAPDANRGIPSVPRIPAQFKDHRHHDTSVRDSGVGDVENCGVW